MNRTVEFAISTGRRTQFMAITRQVAEQVVKNSWQDGVLTLFIPHTTAGVTIMKMPIRMWPGIWNGSVTN